MTEKVTEQGAEFRVNGARLIGDMSGAVYWPAAGTLIVADLHLKSFGLCHAWGGFAAYDTAETLNRLEACLERFARAFWCRWVTVFTILAGRSAWRPGTRRALSVLADRLKPFGCWAITTQHHRRSGG